MAALPDDLFATDADGWDGRRRVRPVSAEAAATDGALLRTPLHALHRRLKAKLVPFAGYEMPLRYRGVVAENRQTRRAAALFDVSHMGQLLVRGSNAAGALERLTPLDLEAMGADRQAYALMTNPQGGVIDDMMVTRWGAESFFLVVNASRRQVDFEHLRRHLPADVSLSWLADRALLALQGPAAHAALSALAPSVAKLRFLHGAEARLAGAECYVTRSGYTGEDGFEISCPAERAEALAESMLSSPDVEMAGLGARDTLRVEAGLCLYGNELNADTTPVEAGLSWTVAKSRRRGGRKAGGFLGAERILRQMSGDVPRRRCGLVAEAGAVPRAGAALFADEDLKRRAGTVSSGSFSPTLGRPIAMAYVQTRWLRPGRALSASLRGRPRAVRVAEMPFVPTRYRRN